MRLGKHLFAILFIFVSVQCLAQGVTVSERKYPFGIVTFPDTTKLIGVNDGNFIDGYVKKIGRLLFVYPVGQSNRYRPFASNGDGTLGAFFSGSPGNSDAPSGGPFLVSSRSGDIERVSEKEFWDIDGGDSSKITLTWKESSSISELTNGNLLKLGIVGWSKSSKRWESIAASIDEVSLFGGASDLLTGSITTKEPIIPDNYLVITLGCLVNQAPSVAYEGKVESIDCSTVEGWVWDKNSPNSLLIVEVLENGRVVASGLASKQRSDLGSLAQGTGRYGFEIPIPRQLLDQRTHQVSIRVYGSNFILGNSPLTLDCGMNGQLSSSDCFSISGWAWDKNYQASELNIDIFDGEAIVGSTKANLFRSDLYNSGFGSGYYGFRLTLPSTVKDGQEHALTGKIRGTTFILPGSPKTVTCPASSFTGKFEYADCSVIQGWAWDRNNPNSQVIVELVEGNTVYATTVANIYREALKNAGTGTGNYGFSMAVPASLKDGKAHQLSIRVQGTGVLLTDSPKTLTCGAPAYGGKFEYADCSVIQGWAWNASSPATSLTVELVEGSTVYATAVANIYREALKNAGTGTGNYGFSIAVPASLKDGKAHQLSIRVQGTSVLLTDSPKTLTCGSPTYGGKFEYADCSVIQGWAWNASSPATSLTVELVEGSTVYATAVANIYREALKNAGTGTGNYGFSMAVPSSLKDGKAHQLSIRVQGTSVLLTDSPKTLTCGAPAYGGKFEYADCSVIQGWAWNASSPATSLTVELVEGSTVYATAVANIYREALKNAGTGTGNYGFSIAVPASLKDGKAHQLSIRVQGTSVLLTDSPKTLTCGSPTYGGKFEYADCSVIQGWAWNASSPATSLTVELVEGSTVYATAVASIYREALKNAGTGTGNYGFSIAVPSSLKDGKAHQLSIRVQGTSVLLTDSPKTLTCGSPTYGGKFEYADCSVIQGWAWNASSPATSLTVELVEGSTVYATTVANIYREALKNAGTGTGNYGFSMAVPASLKDGKAHQLSIRVQGTGVLLTDSPKTLTCGAPAYGGKFEYADCSVIQGWAWNPGSPATSLTVELVEGSTVYATAVASIYREALKNAGVGTGNYGFSMAVPASLKDGKAHQLSIRVQGTSVLLTDSPKTLTCGSPTYGGKFEYADCSVIQGWAWNASSPATSLTVELVEGSTVYATAVASIYREALKNAGTGTGNYGFSIAVPASLKDGKAHQLSIRVQGTSVLLTDSPKTLTCGSFAGKFEYADCSVIQGWAWNPGSPATSLTVELVEGSTVYATAVASIYREALKNAGVGTGNYGFSMAVPASLKDGKAHQLSIRVQGTSVLLTDSPKTLTCGSPTYGGKFEYADCSVIQGWAWNASSPATSLTVELVEGSTVYATAVASTYREALKNAGVGTGNYGFLFSTPTVLRDGKSHSLSVRIKDTGFLLANSPRNVSCPSIARISGESDGNGMENSTAGRELIESVAGKFTIFPNPSPGNFQVRFKIPLSARCSLTVVTMTGLVVSHQDVEGSGTHEARIQASDWPAGVYLVKLQIGTRIEVQRLLLAK